LQLYAASDFPRWFPSSAIGLGFLINNDILRPLLIVFLLVAIVGLAVAA
jgi:hypothetical protein